MHRERASLTLPPPSPASFPTHCRPDAEVFVAKTNVTVGSVYKKAVYRQYTDARFTQRVRRRHDLDTWCCGRLTTCPAPVAASAVQVHAPASPLPLRQRQASRPPCLPFSTTCALQVAAPAFQGVLGPTLFAEVGQTLEVVFQVR